jgi:hypothetical protein
MGGYDKSPDYGGPEPHWREIIITVLVMLGVTAVLTFGGLFGIFRRLITP